MGKKIQNAKRKLFHSFSGFDGVFYGVNTENQCLVWITQNVDPTFFVELAVFRFSYPVFHHFKRHTKKMTAKRSVISIDCRNSEALNYFMELTI